MKLFTAPTINLSETWSQFTGNPSKHLYVNSLGHIEVKCYSAKVWTIFERQQIKEAMKLYESIKPTPFDRKHIPEQYK